MYTCEEEISAIDMLSSTGLFRSFSDKTLLENLAKSKLKKFTQPASSADMRSLGLSESAYNFQNAVFVTLLTWTFFLPH